MKAWVREALGGVDVYQWKDFELSDPEEGEVQVKVISSSVNPIDKIRRTHGLNTIGGKADEFPVIDGYDVCGEVVKCGPGTSRFQPKDMVFGDIQQSSTGPQRFGAWAEYVNAKESVLAKLPSGMDPVLAGGVGVVFSTFMQAIEQCGIEKPRKVLVLGGAGGTGCAALQVCKHVLHVEKLVTTASGKKVEFVKEMGADVVVDYRSKDFVEELKDEKFDFVYDTTGEANKAVSVLGDEGAVATIASFVPMDRVKLIGLTPKAEYLEKLESFFADGKLKVPAEVFELSKFTDGLELSASGRAIGKVVLRMC
eukprot:Plantae.Rhodophyta-Purpureofilum_apyrenoidigerum.ctg19966.p1 GENE.Plantae.Rhodophyta-Purpureofilum_apyrenoidigerum.ctg19966~~Plantae.Rhodophyta-Purpureofilum_apyrenoidigerum.ctg19966.p1  ORF type:complete len:341 (-),score=82.32 Plantae.Rhodophyta-Purpureofilum_apyrenoidigerum.ctg19966:131-1060(-)